MREAANVNAGKPGLALLLAAAAVMLVLPSLMPFSGGAGAQNVGSDGQGSEEKLETLDVRNFSRPTIITNRWLPMKPGTRWIYQGTTVEDDGKVVPHRIEIAVTDLVKSIAGTCAVVSYDLDYSDGVLVEAELALFAQDDDGNVWRLGEYPEEYENGKFIKAPAWIHGFEGARAGIMMPAEPRLGTPSFAQGWGPAVGWTDRGMTHQVGLDVTVRAGNYKDVLVIRETAHSEIDAQQLKYYAAGVGNIKVGWTGQRDKTKEILELVRVEQLSSKALAELRAKALRLERSAYQKSKNVYAHTRPATENKPGRSCQ